MKLLLGSCQRPGWVLCSGIVHSLLLSPPDAQLQLQPFSLSQRLSTPLAFQTAVLLLLAGPEAVP